MKRLRFYIGRAWLLLGLWIMPSDAEASIRYNVRFFADHKMNDVTNEMIEAFNRECRHHSGWQTLPQDSIRRGLAAALVRKPVGEEELCNAICEWDQPGACACRKNGVKMHTRCPAVVGVTRAVLALLSPNNITVTPT